MTNEWVESESCIARERNKLRALVEELVEAVEQGGSHTAIHVDHSDDYRDRCSVCQFRAALAKARKVLNP